MPVILNEADYGKWLGEESAERDELVAALKPCPAELIEAYPVDARVGDVRNDDPALNRA